MNMETKKLRELYHATSKHSNYQVLPAALHRILGGGDISVNSRHELARLLYICSKIDMSGLCVADIGGNTGYFSFEILEKGADSLSYYEGNKAHHDFVAGAATLLGLDDKLQTFNEYVDFQTTNLPKFDCVLLLNVLHHVGDDYGDQHINIENARQAILHSLAEISRQTHWLVFQLGFNWKGDRGLPIFEHGTKTELIDFISKGTSHDWNIHSIGIAEQNGDGIIFNDLNCSNTQRDDRLGEFLNRPLFIMQSKRTE